MSRSNFDTICSNNLETVEMIAGSNRTLVYDLYQADNTPIAVEAVSSFTVKIFRYGDPSNVFISESGSPIASGDDNRFTVFISGSASQGLSGGVYQQQVVIRDNFNQHYIPAQGKIIIFPGVSY